MICPKCGKNNEDGELLCSECGARLEASAKAIKHDTCEPADSTQDEVQNEALNAQINAQTAQENKNSSTGAIVFFALIMLVFIISCSVMIKRMADFSGAAAGPNDGEEIAEAAAPIIGTWVEADPEPEPEELAFLEYHFLPDGTGYIYLKGMTSPKNITWEYTGDEDHGSIRVAYAGSRRYNRIFVYDSGSLVVSDVPFVRISQEDVLEDDTVAEPLDETAMEYVGTWWATGMNKVSAPVLELGADGRGQFNLSADGFFTTFTWKYEESKEDDRCDGYILVHYVSIDSPDVKFSVEDGEIDINIYGSYERVE
jgi:hypothetical protein